MESVPALQRLGGLRREEARTLPWSATAADSDGVECLWGIDWERGRICLVAEKTSHYRETPICQELRTILEEVKLAAPDDPSPAHTVSFNNLTRIGKKIIEDAGLTPWPKTFQAMRSSCENDWKEDGIAEATYTAWLGHSAEVSRKSYVAPKDSEFDRVVGKVG